ncbi:hypothetical protein HDF16_004353 [Granulicella aggregans]|uniref:Uncharacterized protein n=1 Tax=Granulicella aggregans TaxID=474949 RepID=A0A7W8E5F9_9BACT|nr:hypothetical protein [Granulicella aggregans]
MIWAQQLKAPGITHLPLSTYPPRVDRGPRNGLPLSMQMICGRDQRLNASYNLLRMPAKESVSSTRGTPILTIRAGSYRALPSETFVAMYSCQDAIVFNQGRVVSAGPISSVSELGDITA